MDCSGKLQTSRKILLATHLWLVVQERIGQILLWFWISPWRLDFIRKNVSRMQLLYSQHVPKWRRGRETRKDIIWNPSTHGMPHFWSLQKKVSTLPTSFVGLISTGPCLNMRPFPCYRASLPILIQYTTFTVWQGRKKNITFTKNTQSFTRNSRPIASHTKSP